MCIHKTGQQGNGSEYINTIINTARHETLSDTRRLDLLMCHRLTPRARLNTYTECHSLAPRASIISHRVPHTDVTCPPHLACTVMRDEAGT